MINLFSQDKSEFCILRITYTVKTAGLDAKLQLDLGSNPNHSLKDIFENTKGGTITIKNIDGTSTVIKSEIDFLTVIQQFGFYLKDVFTMTLLDKSYANFIFEKKQ